MQPVGVGCLSSTGRFPVFVLIILRTDLSHSPSQWASTSAISLDPRKNPFGARQGWK